MKTKHVRLRIGHPIYCGSCGESRYFGYGPCSSCGNQPNKEAIDNIRKNGVNIDESGKLITNKT